MNHPRCHLARYNHAPFRRLRCARQSADYSQSIISTLIALFSHIFFSVLLKACCLKPQSSLIQQQVRSDSFSKHRKLPSPVRGIWDIWPEKDNLSKQTELTDCISSLLWGVEKSIISTRSNVCFMRDWLWCTDKIKSASSVSVISKPNGTWRLSQMGRAT